LGNEIEFDYSLT